MTHTEIFTLLKESRLAELHELGALDTCLLRMAVNRGYIDIDTANYWSAMLMD